MFLYYAIGLCLKIMSLPAEYDAAINKAWQLLLGQRHMIRSQVHRQKRVKQERVKHQS